MLINQIISAFMAFGVCLGGIDAVLGNRFGFGSRFEQGFRLPGPIALSMAGIICMTPTLSVILEFTLVPLLKLIHMDPGIFGGLLAIDMDGYSLAAKLVGGILGAAIAFIAARNMHGVKSGKDIETLE